MQILEAAHLFFQLIGYESYRNDHISKLGVVTGGHKSTALWMLMLRNLRKLSRRFAPTWLVLASAHERSVLSSQHQKVYQLREYGGRQSCSRFQRTVKEKSLVCFQ